MKLDSFVNILVYDKLLKYVQTQLLAFKEENADEVSTKDVNIEIPLEDDNDDNNSHANVEIEATADDLIDDKIEEVCEVVAQQS